MLNLRRMQPPVRRVLAIDPGGQRLRLLLAETNFGRLRIIKQEMIDLQAEGLVSADETRTELQETLERMGRPPLVLVLPQHLSTSQIIDLPTAPETEVEQLIRDETLKLGGVSDTRIIYDFVRMKGGAKGRQQFWVTISQEGDIRERIKNLGIEREDICNVTTTANALITAHRESAKDLSRGILVHLGAQSTVIVILMDGEGVFASSFQMGGDFLTRSLARILNTSEDAAEKIRREKNLFSGEFAHEEFIHGVDGWVAEVKRQLNEWFALNPALAAEVATFQLIASGGGFGQPGLLEYLNREADLRLARWTDQPSGRQGDRPDEGFEVAYGAAVEGLGLGSQKVSLLPQDYRIAWRKRLVQQRVELASVGLVILCILMLAAGTWHKVRLIDIKERLRDKTVAAKEAFDANEALNSELVEDYDTLRPVFAADQNTRDTLSTLALLQQARGTQSFWFVLLSDQQSYFTPPPHLMATNRPVKPREGPPLITVERPAWMLPPSTNLAVAKPGCIAELSMAETGEKARLVLSQLVNGLKTQGLFSKVDSLSDDLRRNLAEPGVIVADSHFVIALDFANTEFQQPIRPRKMSPAVKGTKRLKSPWSAEDALNGRLTP